jgi:CRP/FNR family transcriptional regulator, cyclic AMP receptor protein
MGCYRGDPDCRRISDQLDRDSSIGPTSWERYDHSSIGRSYDVLAKQPAEEILFHWFRSARLVGELSDLMKRRHFSTLMNSPGSIRRECEWDSHLSQSPDGTLEPCRSFFNAQGAEKGTARLRKFDPHKFLAKVGEGKIVSPYRRDQVVFSQGEIADAVFYIQQGKVKLTVVSEQGKEAVVAILGPGHFFGEGCLNGHPLRIATARTVEDDCLVTRLEKATMIATIHKEPDFSELFMSYLLTRNGRIEEDLIDQLFNSSEKRLVRLLLLLANFGKEGKPEPIVGKFSQETLADMIGTTRSRVSKFMNKFRDLGFIRYSGSTIEVHGALLSVLLNDKPQIRRDDAIDAE